jgi:hypothetical protein
MPTPARGRSVQINADEIVNLERQLGDLGQVAFLRSTEPSSSEPGGTLITASGDDAVMEHK